MGFVSGQDSVYSRTIAAAGAMERPDISSHNGAMASKSPTPIHCIEKQRLLEDYTAAVSEFNRMHSAQLAAVRKGEDFPFEEQIARAAERRENAKYAILAHQEKHGC